MPERRRYEWESDAAESRDERVRRAEQQLEDSRAAEAAADERYRQWVAEHGDEPGATYSDTGGGRPELAASSAIEQLDAARERQARGDTGLDDPWLSGGGAISRGGGSGYGGYGSDGRLSYGEEAASYIPVVGNLSGLQGQRQRYEDQTEAERNRQYWHDLGATAPSVDALTPDTYLEANTDEYGNLIGGPSQLEGFGTSDDQRAALNQLQQLSRGELTDADRNMSRALRDQQGMQMGAANQAAMQQMQARGMGGSGAELAMRMGSADSMAGANSNADAQLQQSAQARAMQALQGYAAQGNTIQEQELARRNALDSFNTQNMDWRRGRETRNTQWSNQGARDRTGAVQQAYENRAGVAAGATGQYSTDSGNRQAQRNREAQQEQATVGLIAGLLD